MEKETKKKAKSTKATKTTKKTNVTTKKTTRVSKPRVKKEEVIEVKNEIIEPEKTIVEVQENKIEKDDTSFSLIEVVILILLTAFIFSAVSGVLVYKNYYRINIAKDRTTDGKNGELSEFIENYNRINNDYVEEVNKKELIEAAIKGMYNYLNDGYSMYLSKEDTDSLEEQLSGEYTGIGIEIRSELVSENEYVTKINRVFKDTPAMKAGLKEEDIILKIDDVDVVDASTVADTIKKGNKEEYKITYSRNGKENTVTIKREKVFIESVTKEVYGNVGYIKIETFSNTTKEQVEKLIKSFDKKVTSLVIDVRDNTGGYLTAAYETSDLFVERGKIIYELKDRTGRIESFSAKEGVARKFKKIAVLINSGSASASEILALALKESAGAVIVGTKSYGKGTVQETKDLRSGAMVKYTVAYWLSPKGNSIDKVGIKPDIEEKIVNNQLDKAVKAVK